MKNLTFYAMILFVTLACSPAKTTNNAEFPKLRVKGSSIVNSMEEIVCLKGVSFSDPDKLEKDGNWNLAYFSEAASWGCNVVRFPVHPSAWRSRGEKDYLELLDQGVEWAEATGMYVIIDWHSIGNLIEERFFMPMYDTSWEETLSFWKTIANRYKNNNNVAMYELYNEPTDHNGALGQLNWGIWKAKIEELIDEVSAIDDQKIFLVAGMDWGYLLDEVPDNPVERANVAYVTHPYPQKREQPWEPQWEQDWGKVADLYPVVATEFGFVGAGERGEHVPCIGDETYGEAIIRFFDSKGISYVVWVFDPDWAPALIEDYSFTPTRQGRFFKAVLEKNMEQAKKSNKQ